MRLKLPISLDTLVLLLLVPVYTQQVSQPYLLGVSLLLYIAIELYHPLSSYAVLPQQINKTRILFLVRLSLLFMIIFAACILPTAEGILLRSSAVVEDDGYSEAYETMHDGAIHMEAALSFLWDGINPYVARYSDTPMRFFGFSGVDLPENPHFEYFPYLPGFLYLSSPLYLLSSRLDLFFDQRIIYLSAYLLLTLLLPLLVDAPAHKLLLLATVALNPLLVGPVILGMNDVIIILLLVASVLLLMKQRFYWSALLLAFACATKQSAWFVTPFYFLLVARLLPPEKRARTLVRVAAITAIVPLLSLIPFLLWDGRAFLTDVMSFPSGATAINYPIRGYTLGNLLVGLNVIGSAMDYFPFWVFQLLLGIPLLLSLLRYQWRRGDTGMMLFLSGFFTLGLGFLSRYFQDNYLGYVSVMMGLGILMSPQLGVDVGGTEG
jgi:hypothetical protein